MCDLLTLMEESIGDRLKRLRKAAGLTQAQLAKAVGLSQSAIGNIEAGLRGYGESVVFIAEALKTEPQVLQMVARGSRSAESAKPSEDDDEPVFFSRGPKQAIPLSDNPDYPAIRRVALKAQAGVTGYAVDYMNEDGPPIVFRKDWYTAHGYKPEKMMAIRVSGESMVPNLYPDDLIVINSAQTEPKDGIAFVCIYEGEVVVKRLVRDSGQWWLSSDNADQRRYPRKACDQSTEIVGEVVYRQTERI